MPIGFGEAVPGRIARADRHPAADTGQRDQYRRQRSLRTKLLPGLQKYLTFP
jgi:hypothetical protein